MARELDANIRMALKPIFKRGRGRILADDYDESDAKQLGKGAFSVVWRVRHRRTGVEYAAKVVTMKGMTMDQKKNTMRALLCEAGVAAVTKHPAIVSFHDLIFEDDRIVLIQEYCHGGTLLAMVQKQVDRKRHERRAAAAAVKAGKTNNKSSTNEGGGGGGENVGGSSEAGGDGGRAASGNAAAAATAIASGGGALREREASIALRRVAESLQHLHQQGYVHRDVKLENLLLAVPGDLNTLKLADFGFATSVSNAAGRRGSAFAVKDFTGDRLQGTVEYAAPEVLAELGSAVGNTGGDGGGSGRKGKSKAATVASTRPTVDMWSAGVTAFLMLGGYHLFDASSDAYSARLRMHNTLQQEYAKPVWAGVSSEAKSVIRRMLCSEAGERVTATELLADPWVMSSLKKGSTMPVKAKTVAAAGSGGGRQVGGLNVGINNGVSDGQTTTSSPPPLRRGHTQPNSESSHRPPGAGAAGGGISSSGSGSTLNNHQPHSAQGATTTGGGGGVIPGGGNRSSSSSALLPKSPLRPIRTGTGTGYRGIDGEEIMGSPTKHRPRPVRGLSLGGGGGGGRTESAWSRRLGGGPGGSPPRAPPPSPPRLQKIPPSFDPKTTTATTVGRPASAHRAAGGPGPVKPPPGMMGSVGFGGGGGGGGGGENGVVGVDDGGDNFRRGSVGSAESSVLSSASPMHSRNASRRGSADSKTSSRRGSLDP